MNKKGKTSEFFHRLDKIGKTVKRSYLYRLISKFLSVACSIILVLLLIVGGLMFYFNMKAKSYEGKGQEYTSPFGLYTIISGSMEPNVSVYDVVITVDKDISDIKVGDIITFISTWDINYGLTVTHRVVDISKNENGEYQLSTKGDNNQSKDGGIVTQNNLVGKVVGRLPQLGRLQYFLATKMGWFLIVFIPALAIIIFDIIKIFKLYVLKDQIEKVKTRKEALAAALQDTKEPETKEMPKEENVYPTIENHTVNEATEIEKVDLPRVDEDGKIKENTLELPVIKNNVDIDTSDDFESITIDVPNEEPQIELQEPIVKPTYEMPSSNILTDKDKEDIELPLKKSSDEDSIDIPIIKKTETQEKQIRRGPLKRR